MLNTIPRPADVISLRLIPVTVSKDSVQRMEEAPEIARREGKRIAPAGGAIMNEPFIERHSRQVLIANPEGVPRTKGVYVIDRENRKYIPVEISPEQEKNLGDMYFNPLDQIKELRYLKWHQILIVLEGGALAANKNHNLVLVPKITYNGTYDYEGSYISAIVLDSAPAPHVRARVCLEKSSSFWLRAEPLVY
jgi:hypothetical protein